MEAAQELIPFAKEILSQKPRRGLVKVYLIGSVLAFFGVAVGVLETVCQPFYAQESVDEDLARLSALERRMSELEIVSQRMEAAAAALDEENEYKAKYQATNGRRNSANRLHAS